MIPFFCFSLHRGNHSLEFQFYHSHLYFVVFTTCGYMLTFVSVLLPLLVTEVPLPSTCWVLTVRTQEIQLIVVLVTEIYYSHIIRIHSQISEGERSIRRSWEESLSVFLCSPDGPHRVHSLPPALNEIKSTVFLTREAFWDLAIFIGGRWHTGTFFPQNSVFPEQKRQVFTINQIVYTTVLAGWYSRYNLISW